MVELCYVTLFSLCKHTDRLNCPNLLVLFIYKIGPENMVFPILVLISKLSLCIRLELSNAFIAS